MRDTARMAHKPVQDDGPEGDAGASQSATTLMTPAPMVERAFRLLDLLAEVEAPQTLSDLARTLGMSKGSLHGLLKTLESLDVVSVDESRRYSLGPRIYDLAQAYIHHSGLRRFALAAMHRLAASLGQTIFLGCVEHHGVRILERVQADGQTQGLHISAERGTRVHLLAGATGRVILASWPRERREALLRARLLPRFTERSITDPARFLEAVDEAERRGVGEEQGEYLIGVNAVAAPIHGPNQELVALLWAVGFSAHFSGEAFVRASQELRAESEAISRALGADVTDAADAADVRSGK